MVSGATAADLETPIYDPFKVYMGVFGGAVFAEREVAGPPDDPSTSDTFGTIGFLAGVKMRQNGFMYGAEGDFGWILSDYESAPGPCGNFWCDSDWKGHVRGRIGLSTGMMDFFVAGGLAIAELGGNSSSTTALGWTIGGGADGTLSETLTWRVEVLYDEFEETIGPGNQYQGKWSDLTARGALLFEF